MQQMHGSGSGSVEALGQSETFLQFQEQLSRVAKVERPVLLIGERGTGKELAARRLHFLSNRWSGSCITLNCAALAPTLIESELFGYEKGAFTGADARRIGRFEAADGGSLFLDEIGNIPMEAQEKILRVVEYSSFERVGGLGEVEVDVRIIGATNANLPAMAEQGKFKRDLLDRLSFEVLFLPPLRSREEDIMLLANHFASRMAYELGHQEVVEFSQATIAALEAYDWPGNVRELKNVIERAVYRAKGSRIEEIIFDPFETPFQPESTLPMAASGKNIQQIQQERKNISGSLKGAVRALEIEMLQETLQEHRFNQKQTARALGLSYDQLRGLLRKYKGVL